MERLAASQETTNQPRSSHRRPRSGRGRLVIAAGSGAGLLGLGIAFGVGAVPMPLLSNTAASAPKAAVMSPVPSVNESLTQASASPFGYALAKLPAVALTTHPKASPKPTTSAASAQAPTTQASAPTSQQAQPGAGSGLTAQPTAEYETPRGQNQLAWSQAILTALGAPLTSANIVSIGYWMQNEAGSPPYGIVGANNPINVSEPGYGGVPIQSDGDGVTFLMSYPSVQQGVAAIAAYLNRGNYTAMLADLKAGVGLSDPNLASEISLYSGGGYSTIPDAYGQSQGAPLG